MRVLFLTAYPTILGPLPKIAPLMIEGLRDCGLEVDTEHWSRHCEHESLREKILGRAHDIQLVRSHLRRRPADVLLVTTTHDTPALLRDIPLVLATRRRCPAIVLQFHGSMCDVLEGPGHRLFKAASRWLVEHVAAVLVLSTEEARKWRRFCPRARFDVVVNPYRVGHPLAGGKDRPQHRDPPTILFVGRLIASKGIFDLLTAMAIVVRSHTCRLTVAGTGDEASVRTAVAEFGLAGVVDVRGYVEGDDLLALYERSLALVLPTSFGEGFPTVFSEAMEHGLPIVTTRIRGARDLLREGVNALFVETGRPDEIAQAILRLLDDSQLCERMSQANRQRVQQFSPHLVVPLYAEILRSVSVSP